MDKVVHFEISVDDLPRAKAFYGGLFGWQIFEVPGTGYYIVRTVAIDDKQMPKESGAINGGMMKRITPNLPPVLVINVPSIDVYLKNIERTGGKVLVPKMQVNAMGHYARFADPEGNILALWEDIPSGPT